MASRFSMQDTMKMDACLERLRAIDTDGDGTADLKEIMAFLLAEGYDASAAEELMSTLDADGDGELSEEPRTFHGLPRPSAAYHGLPRPSAAFHGLPPFHHRRSSRRRSI